MNAKNIFSFLTQLKDNNNRDWFNEHRGQYDQALQDMLQLVAELIAGVRQFDAEIGNLEAKDALFRIYRDTRFSHDKTPYKTHMGAFIAKGGRKSHGPGYYFHLDPGESFFGGGVWMPDSAFLKSIRHEIYDDYEGLQKILTSKKFKSYYSGLEDFDDKLKKAPKDFPADFEGIEVLKNKSYFCSHVIPESQLLSDDLSKYVVEGLKACAEFNAFLARAKQ